MVDKPQSSSGHPQVVLPGHQSPCQIQQMSNFDFLILSQEFQFLKGAFISQLYQPARDELVLRFNVKNMERKPDLLIKSGRFFCILNREITMPQEPGNFVMSLRKKISNARVKRIRQKDFDRLLVIDLFRKKKMSLIIELFREGNIILVEEAGETAQERDDEGSVEGNAVATTQDKWSDAHNIDDRVRDNLIDEWELSYRNNTEHWEGEDSKDLPEGEEYIKNPLITLCLFRREWKDRSIKPGAVYNYPPSRRNPIGITYDVFASVIRASRSDVVRTLATEMNLSGVWAEEVCFRAGIMKNAPAKELEEEEIKALFDTMNALLQLASGKRQPCLILKEKENDKEKKENPLPTATEAGAEYLGYEPFPFQSRVIPEGAFRKSVETYNAAVAAYYLAIREVEKNTEPNTVAEKVKKLHRQLKQQKDALPKLKEAVELYKLMGDSVWANYQKLNQIFSKFQQLKDKYGFETALKSIGNEEGITGINSSEGTVDILVNASDAGGDESMSGSKTLTLKLHMRNSLNENAERYYDSSKKMKEKLAGAIRAVEETESQLAKAEAEAAKAAASSRPAIREKVFYFEYFRWFYSTEGLLVMGGRDAQSNERLVKKHLNDEDRYIHADIHGAPSVVVKMPAGGKEGTVHKSESPDSEVVNKYIDTLKQAGQFAVCFSRGWAAGISSAAAFWVLPVQVSKTPPAGEFVARGAFIIRGKRNFLEDMPLELAIGLVYLNRKNGIITPWPENEKTIVSSIYTSPVVPKIMCAPPEVLRIYSRKYVEFVPGKMKKEKFCNILSRSFGIEISSFQQAVPSGDVDITASVGIKLVED